MGAGNAAPQTHRVPVMDLGEGVGLLGVQLRPFVDEATDELVVRVEMVGGMMSSIVGILPHTVPVGELVRLPLSKVRVVFTAGADAVEPALGDGEAPASAPGLVVAK